MRPLGYILIALSIFVYYEAFKGRMITDVGKDIGDISKAAITLDVGKIQKVIKRDGNTLEQETGNATNSNSGNSDSGFGAANSTIGTKVLSEAKRLGSAAAGYRLGGIGPVYYDCSGLIWRAMVNSGIKVPRFSSYTFVVMVPKKTRVTDIKPGDILLWVGHMAIAENNSSAYNALNPSKGIRSSSIDGLRKSLGNFTIWRLKP